MKLININDQKKTVCNVKVGENVVICDFVNLYGCSIDDNSKMGTFVEIQKNASVGKNCKVQSHTFICEGVHIKDNVFIGHHVSFTNDKYPRSVNPDGSIKTDKDWQVIETTVDEGASIGTGATILAGVVIGKNSIVGAGSVVTKNVPPKTIAAGNPARVLRKL